MRPTAPQPAAKWKADVAKQLFYGQTELLASNEETE
jgi:hypothetical protein